MSKLSQKAKNASREYKDIDVLFDRELFGEQKRLSDIVRKARDTYQASTEEGYDGDPRYALQAFNNAQTALTEYLETIRDEFVVIRVVEVPDHEWRAIKARNPLPEDQNTWGPVDRKYGLNAIASTKAALELTGLEVERDEEGKETTSKPSSEVWAEAFANLSSSDLMSLVLAQVELNEIVYAGGYTAAKKG
ncbi:hypothetical protein [Pseudoclavibacter sp. JSM 162008]|uniref:hypothetical protein n=1 Tax=Pseudoclavibacter sp. JSM 162008 TaxID=3229855 RepID=UPI0035251543